MELRKYVNYDGLLYASIETYCSFTNIGRSMDKEELRAFDREKIEESEI